MMTEKGRLSRFEAVAQRLVEGSIDRLLGEHILLRAIGRALARALEDGANEGQAPARYEVLLHPADYAALGSQRPAISRRLALYLHDLADQANLRLSDTPEVRLVAVDDAIRPKQVQVRPLTESVSETTQVYHQVERRARQRLQTLDAFVIVNGKRHVALDKPLITIGRRMDNDIIIDAPVISREHAHIRWRYGRFVLYDAGSRGGVAVNGEPCQECVLQAGDLITLSGQISLIYGEGIANRDQLPSSSMEQTQETQAFPTVEEQ